jgi:hypothetical protein
MNRRTGVGGEEFGITFALAMPDNLVHGSDSPESAQRELELFGRVVGELLVGPAAAELER